MRNTYHQMVTLSLPADVNEEIQTEVKKHPDKYKSRHNFIMVAISHELARLRRKKM